MKSNAGSEARVLHSHLIHIDRHRLGPRFYLLGRRIHEWQLGAGVLALGVTARAVELIGDWMAALLVAAAAWLIAKDWQDLFASRRDTCGWRLGIHRRIAELRASRRGDWLPPPAAVAVGVVGLVNAVSTLTPNLGWEGHTLLHLEPVRFVPLFHALALPASAGLIVAAIYLGRRRQRAWQLAFSSLLALGALNLLKGLDLEESLLSFATAGLLWWGREAFYVRHDPLTLRSAVGRVAGVGLAIVALAGSAALAVAPSGASLRLVGWEALDLLLWSDGPFHLHGELMLLPVGVGLASACALLAGAWLLFRPLAVPRSLPGPSARRAAAELVRSHGTDTLAYFKLRSDKHYLFSPDRRAFLGYRIESGVLLVSGDPVGPPEAIPGLVREACGFAEARGLRIGAVGASAGSLSLWEAAGLRSLYIGDEAIVETGSFSLEGRAIRKVRQSVSRLESAGYTTRLAGVAELGHGELEELDRVSELWCEGRPERGFSMAMDSVREGGVVVVARDSDGDLRGYLHLVPSYGRQAMSLSSMRRDRATPNGLTEFLVVRAIELLADRGVEELSLNFAAFGRFLHSPCTSCERLLGRLVALANPYFQIESLHRFNAKFFPRWEPRYLVYEGALGLPRAGLAALWAEGQLRKPALRLGFGSRA